MKALSKTDLESFKDTYRSLSGCCLDAETASRVEAAVKLYAFVESIPDEDTGYALTKQSDGSFGIFYESQDYTGHG